MDAAKELLQWMQENGGEVHPSLELKHDNAMGLSVYTNDQIEAESRLIACPFEIAITPEVSLEAVRTLYPSAKTDGWSEKKLIGVYLCLHWVYKGSASGSEWPACLRHVKYVAALPSRDSLLSPMQFTAEEEPLLEGTNLHGAVRDRNSQLKEEWQTVQDELHLEALTLPMYIDASTYISSRAFPSKLLTLPKEGSSGTKVKETSPADVKDEESHPLLLPGLDLLNHSRGQPITWISSPLASTSTPCVTFVNPASIPSSSQVFNNYGPRSNEELLMEYGFVIPSNPDDTVILRLGAASSLPPHVAGRLKRKKLDSTQRFLLRRDGQVPKDLVEIMRVMLDQNNSHANCTHDHDHDSAHHDHEDEDEEDEDEETEHEMHEKEMREMQLELDVLGTLGGMLDDKLEKLTQGPVEVEGAGAAVSESCREYRQGQIDILETTMGRLEERIERLERLMDEGMGGCPCCS